METEKLDGFEEFLQDENYLRLKNEIFNEKKSQSFDGNLVAFIMLYYSYYHMDKYKYLFKDEEKSVADFKKTFFAKAFFIWQMNHRIRSFTSKRGRKLHFMKNSWLWREDSVYAYIKAGLHYNAPVLMVTWNYKGNEMKQNWNIIVEIQRVEDRILARIYNGYSFYQVDLSRWIKSKSLYKGIGYFR